MITIFAGPMFSGKTTSLIDHANRTGAQFVWKPLRDTRDASTVVKSHDDVEIEARTLASVSQLLVNHVKVGDEYLAISAPDTIYIDEAQFLPVDLATEIAFLGENRDIYLSMLDTDFLGNTFPAFEIFTNFDHRLVKKQAKCEVCSGPASFSHRIVDSSELILCGSKEAYEPRCGDHFPVLRMRREISEHP
jgi:thymidine kinase